MTDHTHTDKFGVFSLFFVVISAKISWYWVCSWAIIEQMKAAHQLYYYYY